MKISIERDDFRKRLQQALKNAEYSSDSPTQLAREFNLRFAGRAVTVHAARKWLIGEAIPTQEKLRILAEWLGVAAEWLRFGGDVRITTHVADGTSGATSEISERFASEDVKLIADLQRLDVQYQTIVREFIRVLVRLKRPT